MLLVSLGCESFNREALRATIETPAPLRTGKLQVVRVHLVDRDGAPVRDANVTIDGGMPQHGHGLPTKPRVSGGADGTVVVGWSSNGIVTAAIRSPRGVWGQPARVSRPGAEANDVRFAVGADEDGDWSGRRLSASPDQPVVLVVGLLDPSESVRLVRAEKTFGQEVAVGSR